MTDAVPFQLSEEGDRDARLKADFRRAEHIARNHDRLIGNGNCKTIWLPGEWPNEWHNGATPSASATVQWLSLDNEEMYKRYGYKTRYTPNSFSYSVNRACFRTLSPEEIDQTTRPKIAFLGCSITFGIGLPEDEIWTSKVTKAVSDFTGQDWLGVNLGQPALSCEGVARIACQLIGRIRPKLVLAHFPDFARREQYVENDDHSVWKSWFARQTVNEPRGSEVAAYYKLTDNEWNNFFQFVRSYHLLQALCQANDAHLVWSTWDHARLDPRIGVMDRYVDMSAYAKVPGDIHSFPEHTRGRDGIHPGPEAHDLIAEAFYKKVKELKLV